MSNTTETGKGDRYADKFGEMSLCGFCRFSVRQIVRSGLGEDWRENEKMEQFLCHSQAVMGQRAAQPRYIMDFVYECEAFMPGIVLVKEKKTEQIPVQAQQAIEQLHAQQAKASCEPPKAAEPPPAPKKKPKA